MSAVPTGALWPVIGRYRKAPVDLLRVQYGLRISLRECKHGERISRTKHDVQIQLDGMIHPLESAIHFNRSSKRPPNGCLLLPNTHTFQRTVLRHTLPDNIIFRLRKELELPKELVIIEEIPDKYSLQCAFPMRLEELNHRLTALFHEQGDVYTQAEFWDYVRRKGKDPAAHSGQ